MVLTCSVPSIKRSFHILATHTRILWSHVQMAQRPKCAGEKNRRLGARDQGLQAIEAMLNASAALLHLGVHPPTAVLEHGQMLLLLVGLLLPPQLCLMPLPCLPLLSLGHTSTVILAHLHQRLTQNKSFAPTLARAACGREACEAAEDKCRM